VNGYKITAKLFCNFSWLLSLAQTWWKERMDNLIAGEDWQDWGN